MLNKHTLPFKKITQQLAILMVVAAVALLVSILLVDAGKIGEFFAHLHYSALSAITLVPTNPVTSAKVLWVCNLVTLELTFIGIELPFRHNQKSAVLLTFAAAAALWLGIASPVESAVNHFWLHSAAFATLPVLSRVMIVSSLVSFVIVCAFMLCFYVAGAFCLMYVYEEPNASFQPKNIGNFTHRIITGLMH